MISLSRAVGGVRSHQRHGADRLGQRAFTGVCSKLSAGAAARPAAACIPDTNCLVPFSEAAAGQEAAAGLVRAAKLEPAASTSGREEAATVVCAV